MRPVRLKRDEIRTAVKERLTSLFSRIDGQTLSAREIPRDRVVVDISSQSFEVHGQHPRSYKCQSSLAIEFSIWERNDVEIEVDQKIEQVVAAMEADPSLQGMAENMALQSIETVVDDSTERRLGSANIVYEILHLVETQPSNKADEFKGVNVGYLF